MPLKSTSHRRNRGGSSSRVWTERAKKEKCSTKRLLWQVYSICTHGAQTVCNWPVGVERDTYCFATCMESQGLSIGPWRSSGHCGHKAAPQERGVVARNGQGCRETCDVLSLLPNSGSAACAWTTMTYSITRWAVARHSYWSAGPTANRTLHIGSHILL